MQERPATPAAPAAIVAFAVLPLIGEGDHVRAAAELPDEWPGPPCWALGRHG
jgi:hypothetical protein